MENITEVPLPKDLEQCRRMLMLLVGMQITDLLGLMTPVL